MERIASLALPQDGREAPREITRGGQLRAALTHLRQLLHVGAVQVLRPAEDQTRDAAWRWWRTARLRWRRAVVACGHVAAQGATTAVVALSSDLLEQHLAVLTPLLPTTVQVGQEGSEQGRPTWGCAPRADRVGTAGAGILGDDLPGEVQ